DFIALFCEKSCELRDAIDVTGGSRFSHGAAIAIGAVNAMHGKHHAAERRSECRAVAGGHSADGVSVISMFERDDGAFLGAADVLPVLHGDFQGDFDGSGAIIREKNAFEWRGDGFAEEQGELFDFRMRESGEEDVVHFRSLFSDGGHDGGMAMAVDVGPPGRDGVEDAAAILGVEINALSVRYAQWRGIERLLR